MSFVLHFFADDAKLAQELAQNEPLLQQSIEHYFESLTKKIAATRVLAAGGSLDAIKQLKIELADETALVIAGEKSETRAVDGLTVLRNHAEHFAAIRATMDHALSRERYVYNLLHHLRDILLDEGRTLQRMVTRPADRELVQTFATQLAAEQQAAGSLSAIGDLNTLYQRLALGERRKHEIERDESDMAQEMRERIAISQRPDGSDPLPGDSVVRLARTCFESVCDAVMGAVNSGRIGDHPNADFEFVNSDLFELLVRKEIDHLRLQDMNNVRKIKVFVVLFREIYNERMQQLL